MPLNDPLAGTDMVYRTSTTAATSGGNLGANKLWLPLWSGEVINAYDQYNMFENMIATRTISGGFSYEFPITGTVDLNAAWEAGQELSGKGNTSRTFKVNLDARPMAAHFETDNIDLLITQWDYRSELARQSGLTLANTRDRQIAVALLAACAVAPITGDPRGSDFTTNAFQAPIDVGNVAPSAATEVTALKVLEGIEDYLVKCQENDVQVTNVYCVVTPKVFQVIRGLGLTRSADISTTAATALAGLNFTKNPMFGGSDEYGGLGAPYTMGMNAMTDSLDYMGVKIVKSNHLPKTDLEGAAIGSAKYNLKCDTINLHGIIFQQEAIAGLSLQGMKVDTVADVRRNTQFTVASMMKGTGIIRPELCRAIVGMNDSTPTRAELRAALNGAANNLTNGFSSEYFSVV
jgi:hypothetical protein